MSAEPQFHANPYPPALEVQCARLEEQITGLRREVRIELEARDVAVGKLERDTREWKAQANEWRGTVGDVGTRAKEESRAYTDQRVDQLREYSEAQIHAAVAQRETNIAQLREYIDGKFEARDEQRRYGTKLALAAIGAATAIITTVVLLANAFIGSQ